MSEETTFTSNQAQEQLQLPKAIDIGNAKVIRAKTLRKKNSLKARKSLLKVRSFRPTKAVMGKSSS